MNLKNLSLFKKSAEAVNWPNGVSHWIGLILSNKCNEILLHWWWHIVILSEVSMIHHSAFLCYYETYWFLPFALANWTSLSKVISQKKCKCILYHIMLALLLSLVWALSVKMNNFLAPLPNNKVGVYSFKNQAVALVVVMVTRAVHDIFTSISSRLFALSWETSRTAAVDLEGWLNAQALIQVCISFLIFAGFVLLGLKSSCL